ncbi:MAG: RcnB family protein [Alphaproteobacteria bacterium]|nr:RcnB family protein [Alphaproteobacteria bacterium]
MRKALIGLLIATTAASPLAAQDNGWRGRGDGEHHQRSDGQRPARQERQQAPQQQQAPRAEQYRGGGWQGRQQAQVQQQQQQVQVQQQVQTRGYRQGYQGQQAYRGGNTQQDAYRQQIEASRAANRQVSQGMPERYQRRAAENEANYERQVREQYRRQDTGSWSRNDWPRNGGDYRANRSGSRDWRNNWNRGWRSDNRYDWQRYRYSNRSLFRSPYYAPYGYGYGYNRLSIGLVLDEIFWGRNYWISDPWQYRLPPAPYGTQWVRYYNDVVLVDVYTGEVIDVIYDFFW